MLGVDDVAAQLGSIGFRCRGCGGCCRRVAEDSNLVLVSPAEVRAIMAATGMAWDEVAEPYPDFIGADGGGGEYTLAWCLRRTVDAASSSGTGGARSMLTAPPGSAAPIRSCWWTTTSRYRSVPASVRGSPPLRCARCGDRPLQAAGRRDGGGGRYPRRLP
ncbi:hypothetical protein [Methanoculleus chikugoensis]|uniref:hypothetical protein n=1 Tax=Methanoculleus chikugoensis TaxID=118126 RepID=UPI001FB2DB76|nr:hypothetical protein [Methanoculleus chikugoensis]